MIMGIRALFYRRICKPVMLSVIAILLGSVKAILLGSVLAILLGCAEGLHTCFPLFRSVLIQLIVVIEFKIGRHC